MDIQTTGELPSPKLLDLVRNAIRIRHYSLRTEDSYVYWIRFFGQSINGVQLGIVFFMTINVKLTPVALLTPVVDAHVRRLEALRRAGIVERVTEGVWRVPADPSKDGSTTRAGWAAWPLNCARICPSSGRLA